MSHIYESMKVSIYQLQNIYSGLKQSNTSGDASKS